MTEKEWLECAELTPMAKFYFAEERKRRLFTVACFRRIWPLIPDQRSRIAVEAVEKGEGDNRWEREIEEKAEEAVWESDGMARRLAARGVAEFIFSTERPPLHTPLPEAMKKRVERYGSYHTQCPEVIAKAVGLCVDESIREKSMAAERHSQADLFRDIFGNPFRPVTISPAWLTPLTPTVVRLAQVIYDDRAFGKMPELADALHEAGCDNEEILDHCRGAGPHVRGCWVVDLVLGRE